jgi:hypothetical protein
MQTAGELGEAASRFGSFYFADEMKRQSRETPTALFSPDTMPCPTNRNITLDDEPINKP